MTALPILATLTAGAALAAPTLPVHPDRGPTAGGTEVTVAAPYSGPVQMATGGLTSLLLRGDGTVESWGQGYYGALGTGTDEDQRAPGPVDTTGVLADATIVDIATSGYTALARDAEGALYSWGNGAGGELGNGTTDDALSPVTVDRSGALSGKDVVQMGMGSAGPSVLTEDGSVISWGGSLGNGTADISEVPVAIDTSAWAGQAVAQLEVGYGTTFVVTDQGTAYGWGDNLYGQLGDGTTDERLSPVPVDMTGVLAGKRIAEIAAASDHTIALTTDGGLYAWGRDAGGRLGTGTGTGADISITTPVPVDMTGALAGREVVDIDAGSSTAFAVTDDGTVVGWGSGSNGELGTGAATNSTVPVPVDTTGALAGLRVTQISPDVFHTTVLADDGALYAWGSGSLGRGTYERALAPVQITDPVADEVAVTFDGIPADVIGRVDPRTVLVRTPAHPEALVDVAVTVDGGGPTVHPGAFTYGTAPTVTTHPADVSGASGDRVTLTATATGDRAPEPSWEISTDGGATWTAASTGTTTRDAVAGQTSVDLDIDLSAALDGALVRAGFVNGLGTATSEPALLRVDETTEPARTDPAAPSVTTPPILGTGQPPAPTLATRLPVTGTTVVGVLATALLLALAGTLALRTRGRGSAA